MPEFSNFPPSVWGSKGSQLPEFITYFKFQPFSYLLMFLFEGLTKYVASLTRDFVGEIDKNCMKSNGQGASVRVLFLIYQIKKRNDKIKYFFLGAITE